MLTHRHEDLREINRHAAFILADGMPLVWTARWWGTPLPERVAGSDLIFELCRLAAERGYRVYLLGAHPSIAQKAAATLVARYPGLQIVGTASPQLHDLSEAENTAVVAQVREARPDLLFVALGQPKGERWIYTYHRDLEVPVSLQVGAARRLRGRKDPLSSDLAPSARIGVGLSPLSRAAAVGEALSREWVVLHSKALPCGRAKPLSLAWMPTRG